MAPTDSSASRTASPAAIPVAAAAVRAVLWLIVCARMAAAVLRTSIVSASTERLALALSKSSAPRP